MFRFREDLREIWTSAYQRLRGFGVSKVNEYDFTISAKRQWLCGLIFDVVNNYAETCLRSRWRRRHSIPGVNNYSDGNFKKKLKLENAGSLNQNIKFEHSAKIAYALITPTRCPQSHVVDLAIKPSRIISLRKRKNSPPNFRQWFLIRVGQEQQQK